MFSLQAHYRLAIIPMTGRQARLPFVNPLVDDGQRSRLEFVSRNSVGNVEIMANAKVKPVSESSAKLGAYVQRARLEQGLSVRGLAARAKVDYSWLSRLERGRIGSPDARSLWRVARALEVEVADLYLEAGFGDAHGLPGLGPYLGAKYHLPQQAVEQLEAHFALINEKYSQAQEREAADA